MSLIREKPNAHNRRVLTQGETLRVRRNRLNWGVIYAAKRAKISKDALINIEHDRNFQSSKLEKYKSALEAGEREQAVTSSDIAASTTDADVEAAVRKERQRFRAYLVQVQSTAQATLDDVRARIARLDAEETEPGRKRG